MRINSININMGVKLCKKIFRISHINFDEIIKKSWELGARKFTTEFWYTGNEDWKEVIKYTKVFMNNKLKKALG